MATDEDTELVVLADEHVVDEADHAAGDAVSEAVDERLKEEFRHLESLLESLPGAKPPSFTDITELDVARVQAQMRRGMHPAEKLYTGRPLDRLVVNTRYLVMLLLALGGVAIWLVYDTANETLNRPGLAVPLAKVLAGHERAETHPDLVKTVASSAVASYLTRNYWDYAPSRVAVVRHFTPEIRGSLENQLDRDERDTRRTRTRRVALIRDVRHEGVMAETVHTVVVYIDLLEGRATGGNRGSFEGYGRRQLACVLQMIEGEADATNPWGLWISAYYEVAREDWIKENADNDPWSDYDER